jgi:cyclophilin family peptidyl-prolyl cis-trans isomerase
MLLRAYCLAAVLSAGCLGTLLLVELRADDDAGEAPSAAEGEKTWEELIARMREIEARVEAIRGEYAAADADGKAALQEEFGALQTEYVQVILPDVAERAADRLTAMPDDLDAAEIVMQQMSNSNRYEDAARLADLILETRPDNKAALNFGGLAHFATHNFERSHELLESAREQGVLAADVGGQFLEASEDYVEYWATEQEIREREAAAEGDEQLPQVKLTTPHGEILLELFENEAPNTVANFISLVEEGYYNGLKFHRVIPNFMAQGGCPNTRPGSAGFPGEGGPGYRIPCECYAENARRHFAGTLSMAHAGRDTGGSQFFITHLPTPHLDKDLRPDGAHTVFGRVVEGMDVVAAIQVGDLIESAEVVRKRDHAYEPMTLPDR